MSQLLIQNNTDWKIWLQAARPKTLTAAVVPMLVGTCLAARYTEVSWAYTICALLCAIMIQVGTNLVNDALDFRNGCDTVKRLGPKRVSATGLLPSGEVLNLGIFFLMSAILIGLPLVFKGGMPLAIVIGVSALLGYLYTGGPKPLAYHGLGDVFVFLFFGVIATGSIFYIQTGTFEWDLLIAGVQVGMTSTSLIAINNLRDRKEDRQTGKNTFAVRYGKEAARYEITFLLLGPYFVGLLWWSTVTILPLTTLPLSAFLVWQIWKTEPSAMYNQFLAQSSLYHLLFGITLAAGFWLA